jgi:tetratricopeptide (TPR) repeat protein
VLWLVWLAAKARKSAPSWIAFACSAVLVVGVYFSLRTTAASTPPPPSKETTTLVERAGLMTRALTEYSMLFAAPHNLHMERDITHKPAGQAIAGAVLLAGFAAWAMRARRVAPDAAIALACAGVSWLPVSNAFTLNSTMAEHWLYIPSAFLVAALVFSARVHRWRAVPALAAVWLLFLATQTWLQQDYWRDQRTFITSTMEREGRGKRMLGNLAGLEFENGNTAAGKALLAEAIAKDPEFAGFHLMQFNAAMSENDHATAEAALERAAKDPFFRAEVLLLRSSLHMAKTGKPRLDLMAEAVTASPRNWTIARSLPLTLDALGKTSNAYNELLRTVTERTYRAEGWRTLALLAEKLGNITAAMKAYGEAANRDCRDSVSRARIRELQGVQ